MSKKKSSVLIRPEYYDAILSPVVTEKSQMGVEFNKVTFQVLPSATKPLVKSAIEAIFDVEVDRVNIINQEGKTKRFRGVKGKRKNTKKAIVTLKEGQDLDFTSVA